MRTIETGAHTTAALDAAPTHLRERSASTLQDPPPAVARKRDFQSSSCWRQCGDRELAVSEREALLSNKSQGLPNQL